MSVSTALAMAALIRRCSPEACQRVMPLRMASITRIPSVTREF
jgi:hypothetical protein